MTPLGMACRGDRTDDSGLGAGKDQKERNLMGIREGQRKGHGVLSPKSTGLSLVSGFAVYSGKNHGNSGKNGEVERAAGNQEL